MREQLLKVPHTISERLAFICDQLDNLKVDYIKDIFIAEQVVNVTVKLNQPKDFDGKVVVLGAHYDIVPKSTGLNDNGAAIIMLLEFIKNYKDTIKVPMDIVFFDREETGMVGSDLYAAGQYHNIEFALIFDIIAYGDTLVFGSYDKALSRYLINHTSFKQLDQVLPSDNVSFNRYKVPVALITAAPKTDLEELLDGSYKLVGSEFYESFHNRNKDNDINVLNLNLITETTISLSSLFLHYDAAKHALNL
jgi:hypothetical protein